MDAYPILAEKGHASVGAYPILAEKGHASTSAYPILAEKGHASMGAYPILAEKGHAALGNGSSAVLAGLSQGGMPVANHANIRIIVRSFGK